MRTTLAACLAALALALSIPAGAVAVGHSDAGSIDHEPDRDDSDCDGLPNRVEQNRSTSPTNADSDGDGIGDGAEARMGTARPDMRDIFIEIDRMEDADWLSSRGKARMIWSFTTAPLENPGEYDGVRLHIRESDVINETGSVDESRLRDLRAEHKDANATYQYLLLASDVPGANGRAWTHEHMAVVDTSPFFAFKSPSEIAFHEIGHLLGLTPDVYSGIDSGYLFPWGYDSAMNYAYLAQDMDYSSGGAFDDWAYLNRTGFPYLKIRPDGAC